VLWLVKDVRHFVPEASQSRPADRDEQRGNRLFTAVEVGHAARDEVSAWEIVHSHPTTVGDASSGGQIGYSLYDGFDN
jgi:hypothetical protein